MLFFSRHGIHDEERILGNWFEVSVDVKSEKIKSVETISDSINYADVFNIIKKMMNEPTPLLETVADKVINAVYQYDQRISEITFTIKKMNPPIQAFVGNVGITLHKTF